MQTIDRAFGVLRALASKSEMSTLAEVSRVAALPKSTTSRILSSLENLGMVDRVEGRYAIGPGLATLTHHATPVGSLRELARPHLLDLAERLGENASLAVADGDMVLYVDSVAGSGVVQIPDWTGERVIFHGSAAGLSLMSGWSDQQLKHYADGGLEALTPATVTSLTALRKRMRQVGQDEFVWTRAEFSDEVNGVAAPIRDCNGDPVGALTVYGPRYRFPGDRRVGAINAAVVDSAQRLSAHLDSG